MSFRWPWQKSQDQKYLSLHADEGCDQEPSEGPRFINPASSRHSRIFYGLVLLINTAILLWIALQLYSQSFEKSSTEQKLVKTPIPDFPKEIKSFETHPVFMDRPSEESDAAWEGLGGPLRAHQGFIWIEDSAAYGLGSATSDNGKEMYGVSMLHQLHCLGSIRKMLWGVLEGTMDAQKLLDGYPRNTTDPSFEATTHGLWHISHCFDYIRQGIQCAGDMSLEWPIDIHGEKLVVGWNNPHECKSWDAAWTYIETHS